MISSAFPSATTTTHLRTMKLSTISAIAAARLVFSARSFKTNWLDNDRLYDYAVNALVLTAAGLVIMIDCVWFTAREAIESGRIVRSWYDRMMPMADKVVPNAESLVETAIQKATVIAQEITEICRDAEEACLLISTKVQYGLKDLNLCLTQPKIALLRHRSQFKKCLKR
jgi:hypothetical protein